MPQLSIRPMKMEDLKLVLTWAAEEGWNVGKYDAEPYFAQGLEGHKLLLLDGVPIGAISVVKYNSNFAFMGLFIVKPEHRQKGYGKYLWDSALKELSSRVNPQASIGLYSVPKQISRYKASGFNSTFSIQRWNADAPASQLSTSNTCTTLSNTSSFFNQVVSYDEKIFSARREAFLKEMLKCSGVNAFVRLNNDNEVIGYGIIRCCQEGYRIGPLYANDFKDAQSLVETLLATVATTGKSIILDTPTINKYVANLAEYFNLKRIPDHDTELMFKGNLPQAMIDNANRNYAIASLELG